MPPRFRSTREGQSQPRRHVIQVTQDAKTYILIDLVGSTDALAIRKRILSELNIPSDRHFKCCIYHIGFDGELTDDNALTDDQLLSDFRRLTENKINAQYFVEDLTDDNELENMSDLPPAVVPNLSVSAGASIQGNPKPDASASIDPLVVVTNGDGGQQRQHCANPSGYQDPGFLIPEPWVPTIPGTGSGTPTQHVGMRSGHAPLNVGYPPTTPSPSPLRNLHVATDVHRSSTSDSIDVSPRGGLDVGLVQSPSSYSPSLPGVPSVPRYKVVRITFNGASYGQIDLTRHSNAGAVRRDVISRLPTHAPFSDFDIFRAYPSGPTGPLNDTELMLDLEYFGDSQGTLEFLVRVANEHSDSHLPTYAPAQMTHLSNPSRPVGLLSPVPFRRNCIPGSEGWYPTFVPTIGNRANVRPKSVVISGTMTAEEVLSRLYERGCKNVSTMLDKFRISKDPVARGGAGDVYSGELYNGARVALKCFRLAIGNEDQSKLKKTAHELYVWSKCNHPNVLELIGVTHHRDQIAMVSPWMDNGDLRTFLRLYPNADRHDLCVQMTDGVAYLHAENIVHGDIKGANVLISQDGEAKITDFGNSALKEYTLNFATTRNRPGLSIRWAAPEVLDGKFDNSYQADIYALGMTMLEAITGDVPYAYIARETVVMRHIVQGTLPTRPEVCMSTDDDEDYGDLMWSLMNQCWLYEYQHRPSAIDIQHQIRNLTSYNRTDNSRGLQSSLLLQLRPIIPPVPQLPFITPPVPFLFNNSEANPEDNQNTNAGNIFVTIHSDMPVVDVLKYLGDHNCKNVTNEIRGYKASEFPVSTGGFGDIYIAKHPSGTQIGLKCMRLLIDQTDDGRKKLKRTARELYTWSKCLHPNILQLIGVAEHRGRVAMVSPWMQNGDLSRFLTRKPRPSVNLCLLCVQIVDGVNYLHQNDIVHGDLKGANILISDDLIPKITDFGSARMKYLTLHFSKTTKKAGLSVRWAAPEVIDEKTEDFLAEADVYSLGMTILEIITGQHPYACVRNDIAVMKRVTIDKVHPKRPEAYIPTASRQGNVLWDLLTRCWAYNPPDRPTALQVKDIMVEITPQGLC